jgi:hypothetical protein
MPSLELPHWLMIAGTALVVAGLIGVLVSGKSRRKLNHLPTSRPILLASRCRLCQAFSIPGQGTTPSFGRRTGTAPAQVALAGVHPLADITEATQTKARTEAPRAGNSKAAGILVPQPNR